MQTHMTFKDMIKVFKAKFYTVLVDRRTWAVGLMYTLLLVMGFFGLASEAGQEILRAFGGVYDSGIELTSAVVKFLEALLVFYVAIKPLLNLISSWTVRPPSGQEALVPSKS